MKVVAIGTGNVAHHLLPYFSGKGFSVSQLFGRNKRTTTKLARKIKCSPIFDIQKMEQDADLYLLMISDDALEGFAKQLSKHLPLDRLICHTSGSVSSERLKPFPFAGVLYPLQTFSKNRKVDIDKVPFFYSANSDKSKRKIRKVLKQLNKKAKYIDDSNRELLHLAAVFSNNFINHIIVQAKEIAKKSKIDFKLLHPLIEETIRKSLSSDPSDAQTGPAKRNDIKILKKHQRLLKDDETKSKIYKLLSKSISKRYT